MSAKTAMNKNGKNSHYSAHLIADFESPVFVEDPKQLRKILWEASKVANNTPLKCSIHKFPLQGITGVILLAESHIAIHTWPEHGFASVDLLTCGRTLPREGVQTLISALNPRRSEIRFVDRGRMQPR